jgi:hypothetical protein
MENICLSGGAAGADTAWGNAAAKRGDRVIHFSFAGHRCIRENGEIHTLTQEQLNLADAALVKANLTIQRRFPGSNKHVNNLLRRNYYQIIGSSSLYAVTHFEKGKVSGGTAWAVELFLNEHNRETCLAYVFDQYLEKWFMWGEEWVECPTPDTPIGVYTAIGSRELINSGKRAIAEIFGEI